MTHSELLDIIALWKGDVPYTISQYIAFALFYPIKTGDPWGGAILAHGP